MSTSLRIRLSETVCRDYPIHPKPDRNYRSPRHRNGLAGPPSTTNRHSGPTLNDVFSLSKGNTVHLSVACSTRSRPLLPCLESIQDGRRYHKPDNPSGSRLRSTTRLCWVIPVCITDSANLDRRYHHHPTLSKESQRWRKDHGEIAQLVIHIIGIEIRRHPRPFSKEHLPS